MIILQLNNVLNLKNYIFMHKRAYTNCIIILTYIYKKQTEKQTSPRMVHDTHIHNYNASVCE